jgi:glycogen debranching enzyme
MSDIIQLENKFYISANSTYADDRVKVLNHSDTFGIFDRWGDIKQFGEEIQGIYHDGTRFVSDLELHINGKRPLLLSSTIKEENELLSVDLTNPTMELPSLDGVDGHISKGVLYIGRSKFVRNGACYEQIVVNNYSHETHEFDLTLSFGADFKDIFEVRGITRAKRGEVYEIRHLEDNGLVISYLGLDDIKRHTEVHFSQKPDGWERHNRAIFHMRLAPHEQKLLEYTLYFITEEEQRSPIGYQKAQELLEKELKSGNTLIAKVRTSNHRFNQWIQRSQFDLLSLLANTLFGKYPYAGVPWYNTAFGRDGIITALQTLWVVPELARDVLQFLANTQAKGSNINQDSEPGKIIHEVRGGEMAELREIPFKRYYGSVDATPLFVVLAGAYYKRTGDIETIKSIWPNIEAALNWIDEYGDIDKDGFIEYHRKTENGLVNQGWKDSHDSISHEDGTLAEPPIALCEVQGYVYDAKKQGATLASLFGLTDRAEQLEREASVLKRRFNEQFWDEAMQCYVLALDGQKRPCRVVASNMGHCLFSGIADIDKAQKVVTRLLKPDMFSGWGIRTLSTGAMRYNPMSYHNGSVWPHDVAIIADGFSRYGFLEEARQLTHSLFDASQYIDLQRLPELYCGFPRRRGEGPTNYPVACSPQAWSVACVFMLLQACLQIDINAVEKKVYFRSSVLPGEMEMLRIEQLKLGEGCANMELYNDIERNELKTKIRTCPEDWEILFIK